MVWLAEHLTIVVVLIAYLAAMVYHAYVGNRQTRSVNDYIVGGRNIGGIAIGLSFFATFCSTNAFVGFAGISYDFGFAWLLMPFTAVGFAILSWLFIADRLRSFTGSVNALTIPDFIGARFQSSLSRTLSAIVVVTSSMFYMTAIFKGIGNLMEVFFDLPYEVCIGIILVIVVLYTAIGGFISVVKTDGVQGIIMFFAAIMMFYGITHAAGGIESVSALFDNDVNGRPSTGRSQVPLQAIFGIMIAGSIKFLVEPRHLSRFYALKDIRARRQGMLISTTLIFTVLMLLTPIGLYARIIAPGVSIESDLIVPTLIDNVDIFFPVVSAFLFVAVISAAMSSLDSVLLVTATTFQHDVMGMLIKPKSAVGALFASRMYVGVFALATAAMAVNPPGNIVWMASFSGNLYAASFLAPVVLGLYWKRGSGASICASMVVGCVLLIGWQYLPGQENVHPFYASVLGSSLSYIIVAVLTRPTLRPEHSLSKRNYAA